MLHSAEWFLPAPGTAPGCPGPACPGPIFADYSEAMEAEFCLGSTDPKCTLPTPNARQHVTLGQAAGEPQRMNLFLAERIAAAIGGLASASKEISRGNIMTLSYYVSTSTHAVHVSPGRRLTLLWHPAFHVRPSGPAAGTPCVPL